MLARPDIYGDTVVFTCEGDLWLGDLKTNEARRITSDPGTETSARFSPDVYVMPVEGGAPKRLTYDPGMRGLGGVATHSWIGRSP